MKTYTEDYPDLGDSASAMHPPLSEKPRYGRILLAAVLIALVLWYLPY